MEFRSDVSMVVRSMVVRSMVVSKKLLTSVLTSVLTNLLTTVLLLHSLKEGVNNHQKYPICFH